jgi:hypothetical protein
VASSSLNIFGDNCDDVISAETLMMVKEHFIKEFGVPVHTIGWGASGGSMAQYLIAQNYPGLLDGIVPSSSFPDITSITPGVVDCALLEHAFEIGIQTWTDAQKAAVSGFVNWSTCGSKTGWIGMNFTPRLIRPTCGAGVPKALAYDPVTNRKGARCDIYDNEVNTYGRDPQTGFARRPLDNVGVQYGLVAFNRGQISADQFLELNEHAGGYDVDGNMTATRTVADPAALRIAYQSGRMNTGGGGLGSTPIIETRGYADPNVHDKFRSFSERARLMAANGRTDNDVMLVFAPGSGGVLLTSPKSRYVEAVGLMDHWLDNIAKDTSDDSMAIKMIRNKPSDLVDACWTKQGEKIVEPQSYDGHGRCSQLYPAYGDPRIAAGAPVANNVLKCALKPIDPKDYIHPLMDDQMLRMKGIFPQGVCDYSRPGPEQQQVKGTWQRY